MIATGLVYSFEIVPHMSCGGTIRDVKFVTFFNSLVNYFTRAFVVKDPIVVVIGVIGRIWACDRPHSVMEKFIDVEIQHNVFFP